MVRIGMNLKSDFCLYLKADGVLIRVIIRKK